MGAAASSDAKSDRDEGFVTVRSRHAMDARGETEEDVPRVVVGLFSTGFASGG